MYILVTGALLITSVIYGSSFVNCINVKTNPTHTSGVYSETKEKLSRVLPWARGGHPLSR